MRHLVTNQIIFVRVEAQSCCWREKVWKQWAARGVGSVGSGRAALTLHANNEWVKVPFLHAQVGRVVDICCWCKSKPASLSLTEEEASQYFNNNAPQPYCCQMCVGELTERRERESQLIHVQSLLNGAKSEQKTSRTITSFKHLCQPCSLATWKILSLSNILLRHTHFNWLRSLH